MLDGNNTTKSRELKPYMCISVFFLTSESIMYESITKVTFLFKQWALHITLFILQWGFVLLFLLHIVSWNRTIYDYACLVRNAV